MGSQSKTHLTLDKAHAYWRKPPESNNWPSEYIDTANKPQLVQRSEALVNLMRRHAFRDSAILEIGCNAGRNLKYLFEAGYSNLSAVEISQNAIDEMQAQLPDLYAAVNIQVAPIEEVVDTLPTFDVIFTMATMVHLPRESEWVFPKIAGRVKSRLITVEFEHPIDSDRHFPRNYERIFEANGLRLVDMMHPFPGLPSSYYCWVFSPV
ncbi:2-polyprenyl-3-methyl-5-hydroxy-6-metoxy-1,4-benzoquinol methylase [Rhizobium azooxidifex]|uniref:2-polyprenyl-3-methyl-5-hydroxy-6-metoxy-1, 4-benzoquinol methylase n=1 Tax=Mycoplana azooxidifex TaxID=1636188 RepID=A0A7W6DAY9_9HYPH|nr:class I SAM-dependent methyltransferase [Mycoplana azooxidifex]MBB3976423.1 2-polyprenyl-3-methyl-5-hydroxy-6-metoxy-1,4-benzoquinol methylase [Mycoplana azooxidifex]